MSSDNEIRKFVASEFMEKWEVGIWSAYPNVKRMQIKSETPEFVVRADGRRIKKHSQYSVLFDSKQEAVEFAVNLCKEKIESHSISIKNLHAAILEVQSI